MIIDDIDNSITYSFPCNRWLAIDEDDGQTFRDLVAGVGPMEADLGIPIVLLCVLLLNKDDLILTCLQRFNINMTYLRIAFMNSSCDRSIYMDNIHIQFERLA